MRSVHNQYDIPCPACDGKEQTKYVALLPIIIDDDRVIDPHAYAVGTRCYRKQWRKVYKGEKCPV